MAINFALLGTGRIADNALALAVKAANGARLWSVLSGEQTDPVYQRLSQEDRQAIVDILRDTKTGLPAYFTDIPA